MLRRAARAHRNEPRRFVDIVRSYSSIEYFRSSPSREYPALFTRPVTGPASSDTRRNASCTLDSSVTSRNTAMPGVPADSSASSASFASASRVRYPTATVQPAAGQGLRRTRARSPREPPETTATFDVTRAPASSSGPAWRPT